MNDSQQTTVELISAIVEHHGMVTSFLALVFSVIGIWLRWGPRDRRNSEMHAESAGVVVGRDNFGPIDTQNAATTKKEKSSRDWSDFVGTIVAILGIIIAALSWLFPRIPQ